ncbi:hypothetical protein [Luteibacter aegosomatissinici]|uniref:hypothetical protein n=1 Tax=Luteibacter aegosomatissinici TaxID=2911539 RepID=UPI001FFB1F4E|nr:hypothetical protein [Luteibacter aegosomatissinici]UPG92747.1 hypothetical protein L2Y97_12820 [Luteibacter aegosomatissinici]
MSHYDLRLPLTRHSIARLVLALLSVGCALPAAAQTASADASTITGHILVGYQGWFRCPGDGSPWNNWSHLADGQPNGKNLYISNYPITTEWTGVARCKVTTLTVGGQPAYLFSSFPQETADIHFRWMREYGIDGALLQRFTGEIPNHSQEGEAITRHAMKAAEANGRTFAIEYDLSHGDYYDVVSDDQVVADITNDWLHLVNDLHITDSLAYQREAGKPLVSLWGLAFHDDSHPKRAALAGRIIHWFKTVAHAEVMAGVANNYDDPNNGADPAWGDVLKEADIIQPWTVGALSNRDNIDWWKTNKFIPEIKVTDANGQIYMPVIEPGVAGRDSNDVVGQGAARNGGDFFWHQLYTAKSVGAKVIKIAMFDEVNEGTSLLKVAENASQAPDQGTWLNLDADGYQLPSDWYLRLAWNAGRVLRGEDTLTDTVPGDPGPLDPAPSCGVLGPNGVINPGKPLYSCSQLVHVSLDPSGDLTVYRGTTALYSSGTGGQPVVTTVMQGDGNLVEYAKDGTPRWASNTAGHPGAWLDLRNDGKAWIVYQGKVIWTAGP